MKTWASQKVGTFEFRCIHSTTCARIWPDEVRKPLLYIFVWLLFAIDTSCTLISSSLVHTYRHRIHLNSARFSAWWVLTLCQLLTGRMGSRPILLIKVPVTIGTMLNFYWAEYRAEFKLIRCRYMWTRHQAARYVIFATVIVMLEAFVIQSGKGPRCPHTPLPIRQIFTALPSLSVILQMIQMGWI